jgi:membrane protease YdiL (CAAX protease family)
VAWVLSVGGMVLALLIGPMASADEARFVLVIVGIVVLTLGLSAGAGSQILERRDRHPDRYRGPSPLLVFFVYFFVLALLGLVLTSTGVVDPATPWGFLAIGLLQVLGYVVVVWLFAVRSNALSWGQMGWPTWSGRALLPILRAIGVAIGVVLPATFAILVLSGLLATVLGVEAPGVLPTTRSSLEALAVAAVAALFIPIGEELFFRGFALTAWMRDLGPRNAIIRSSLFFALVHTVNISTDQFDEGLGQAILQTAAILPLGLLLGWLFVRHGMAAAIAGHVTYTSVLLFLLLLSSYLPEPA